MTIVLNNNDKTKYTLLRKEPCPRCRSNGRDNSGDNLAIYSDENGDESFHCFSCNYTKASKEYSKNDNINNRYNYEIQNERNFHNRYVE